jgi:hypothetical protein
MKKLGIVIFGCLIKEKYREQVEDCYKTWVRDAIEYGCLVRFYVGNIPSDLDPALKDICVDLEVGDDYLSASLKQWRGFEHMVGSLEECEFYYTCGTDTFLNVKNALKELEAFDSGKKFCIGGGMGEEPVEDFVVKYFSGGAGIFLTGAALFDVLDELPNFMCIWMSNGPRIVTFTDADGVRKNKSILGACDLQLGILCSKVGVKNISLGSLKLIGHGTHNTEGADKKELVSCHLMKHNDFYEYWNWLKDCEKAH